MLASEPVWKVISKTIAALHGVILGKLKVERKYLLEHGPGDASPQARNSQLYQNASNEWLGKVTKFHGDSSNGFLRRADIISVILVAFYRADMTQNKTPNMHFR